MISLEDAAATLRVVVPGFLALRVFYWRALPTRRTDLELLLFGLIASVPIWWLAALVLPPDPSGVAGQPPNETRTILLAVLLALLSGELGARAWGWAAGRWPDLRSRMVATVWDDLLTRPEGGWFQVYTTDKTVYHGWIKTVADTAETDEPDLYLRDPAYVDSGGALFPMPGVEGVLIPRSGVVAILRFLPPGQADPGEATPVPDA